MEQIPYFYDSINRNAIIVRPKKPFFDWLLSVYPDEDPVMDKDENNIYLIREMDSNEQIRDWIKRNFDGLFMNELNDWYTDQLKWPENRTYKMFTDWFDIEFCSMVLDLEDADITKE
jgi:hypothetical protein